MRRDELRLSLVQNQSRIRRYDLEHVADGQRAAVLFANIDNVLADCFDLADVDGETSM